MRNINRKEIEWEKRIIYLISIIIIVFSLLTLRTALMGNKKEIFLAAEVPVMCQALISALLIFGFEVFLWYIVRIKGAKIQRLPWKKQ